MLRVTTLHASSAAATAAYYAKYLTAAPGEVPGVWSGRQADRFGLGGDVTVEQLELLLSGRDPTSGTLLGRELVDRYRTDGRVVRAVSGFDATFSAPKSLSVLWALTGDRRLLQAHDVAVRAALAHLERFGSTTRVRSNGGRLHPDTQGLTIASFRQTTSRADDPQIHTHAVVSAKVHTVDGRWLALDARYLKRHQRMLGGLYQSVLRAELTHLLDVGWGPIVNAQAEIAGVAAELLELFSKRTSDIDVAVDAKLVEFRGREGREPSRWERAALTREASADSRVRKSGHGPVDLMQQWRAEASDIGWTAARLRDTVGAAGREHGVAAPGLTVADVVGHVSVQHSSWGRPEVLRAVCDAQRPIRGVEGERWASLIEQAADRVVAACVDLDPEINTDIDSGSDSIVTVRRRSDGRSVWIEPTAPRYTSEVVLTEEEEILTWVLDAHVEPARPSSQLEGHGLDVLQVDAAASVAGLDRVVLVVGPAGAGKTRMLAAAVDDLEQHSRVVFGLAPSAKAARVLERDTGMRTDTVAKLLFEWQRPDRPPLVDYQLPAGTTVVVDEAGMLSTPALHQLVVLAERHRWRLALIGDPRQLQAVGRGGLFGELCNAGRVVELEQLHRFTHPWEAAASLRLRHGDPTALDAYQAHGRIIAGPLDTHLDRMATTWMTRHRIGDTVALVATTNDHVDVINHTVQQTRLRAGDLTAGASTTTAAGERVYVGDIIATRRNDRYLVTSQRQPVRNRDTWTVAAVGADGSLTVTHTRRHGTVTLPVDYVREHVRLGYAATEHGHQGDTVTTAISLATPATTRRGLYVAATRGRDDNLICVVTDSTDVAEARDTLETIVAIDRADIPAVTQRRQLAQQAQPARPHAPRRATVPPWFDSLLNDAHSELQAAQRRHADMQRARRARHEQLARVETDLAAVEQDAAPPIRHIAALRRHVAHAAATVAEAETRLANARRRQRPAVERDLATARHAHHRADHQLNTVTAAAEPALQRLQQARADRDEADTAIDLQRLDDTINPTGPAVAAAQRRLDALTSWRSWARGDTITADDRTRILTLNDHGHDASGDSRLHELVNTLERWSPTNNIEPPTAPTRNQTPTRIELEL